MCTWNENSQCSSQCSRKGARKKGRLGREIEVKGSECRIVRVGVFLNRNVDNSDWRFNMCGSDVKSVTAGLHPAHETIRHGTAYL